MLLLDGWIVILEKKSNHSTFNIVNKLIENNLPRNWIIVKLGEIAKEINPGFPCGKHNKDDKGVPHLRPMNINIRGEIDFSDVKYVQPELYDPLIKGDVLFNNTNSPELLGKTAFIKENTRWAYSNHMTRIRFDTSLLNPAWISYGLHTLFLSGFFQKNCTHHVNQASINSTFLADKVFISLAPMEEQKRIVEKIEELFAKLDAGVEVLKKINAQLKRYRQAVLKYAFEGKLTEEWRKANKDKIEPASVLLERIKEERRKIVKGKLKELPPVDTSDLAELPEGWVWTRLGEIAGLKNGINFTKSQKGDSGIMTIDVLNMYSKSIFVDLKNLYRVDKTVKEDYLLKYGDILFVRSSVKREGVGWTSAFKEISEPVTFCGFIIRARFHRIFPEYITYFSRTYFAREFIISKGSQVTITNISQESIGRIPIPLPPVEEQRKIVEEIERRFSVVEEAERVVEQSLRQAERLRQSILKKAFEGKLVPQDPNDEPAEKLLERIRAEKAMREESKGKGKISKAKWRKRKVHH